MAEAKTKAKSKVKTADEELNEQIAVFEPTPKAVDRILTNPDSDESRKYVQHEMGFLTKIKFFRVLAQTIRLAGQADLSDPTSGGVADLVDLFLQEGGLDTASANTMITGLLKLIELSPGFIEEAYMYALSVPPEDWSWAQKALDGLDDETGIEILEVFVGQNGPAIRDFFVKRLPKIGKQINQLTNQDTEQE